MWGERPPLTAEQQKAIELIKLHKQQLSVLKIALRHATIRAIKLGCPRAEIGRACGTTGQNISIMARKLGLPRLTDGEVAEKKSHRTVPRHDGADAV